MRIFYEKNCKIRLSVGGSAPESPFAFGGWPPRFYSPSAITTLSSSFLLLNAFHSLKKETSTYTTFVLPLLLPHFCTYFLIQTL